MGTQTTVALSPDAIVRHASRAVPRYTSYPTAPHFHAGIGRESYRSWLGELPENAALSLYLHVPFCDTLCWFCGCHTKITRQYQPIADYLDALAHEIQAVGETVPSGARVTHIHWGGGSPTILEASDIRRVMAQFRRWFRLGPDTEFAVEVDPRGMDEARIDALAESGLTRVSVGVQDFDPGVQAAINRVQPFEETERVISAFRARGVKSVNIDAIYGLPGQGEAQLRHTIGQVLRLAPDRIALFGYAHVPWMKRHQTMINEGDLPGVVDRYHHAEMAGRMLQAAGYVRVGIDHFARPDDALAVAARGGRLQRNFQGYTVDPADALIGFGASAISRLPNGFVQNEPSIAEYQRQVNGFGLAAAKGIALTADDRRRAHVIERLMCDLSVSLSELNREFGEAAANLEACARSVVTEDEDGFVQPTSDGFVVTELGRPFVRTIAARFDAYLQTSRGRHSLAV